MSFTIEKHTTSDKFFYILGPESDDQFIRIDYDDVDHKEVDLQVEKMVKILNDNWNDKKYSKYAEDYAALDFEKWLVNKFYELSEEHANSESIDEIEINGKDPMVITFSIDCGRYGLHRNNTIRITKDKKVIINMDGPLEGSGVESGLKEAIEEKIK